VICGKHGCDRCRQCIRRRIRTTAMVNRARDSRKSYCSFRCGLAVSLSSKDAVVGSCCCICIMGLSSSRVACKDGEVADRNGNLTFWTKDHSSGESAVEVAAVHARCSAIVQANGRLACLSHQSRSDTGEPGRCGIQISYLELF
jgi:hypothetical protein